MATILVVQDIIAELSVIELTEIPEITGVVLATVTFILDANVVFPAASRAFADRIWFPLVVVVVFHETE